MALSKEAEKSFIDAFEQNGLDPHDETSYAWMFEQLCKAGKLDDNKSDSLPIKSENVSSVVNDDKDSTFHAGRDLPRSSIFTGQVFSKNSTFQQWKFEIDCLKHEDNLFSESQIRHIVRRSLKDEAGTIAERLGPKASLTELLDEIAAVKKL